MLNFFRQLAGYPPAERKEKIERWYRIPDEYVPEVLELSDKARLEGGVGRYRLWKRLEEIYPAIKNGSWALDSRHATNIYLVERRRT
jgi:hypothetical protein